MQLCLPARYQCNSFKLVILVRRWCQLFFCINQARLYNRQGAPAPNLGLAPNVTLFEELKASAYRHKKRAPWGAHDTPSSLLVSWRGDTPPDTPLHSALASIYGHYPPMFFSRTAPGINPCQSSAGQHVSCSNTFFACEHYHL